MSAWLRLSSGWAALGLSLWLLSVAARSKRLEMAFRCLAAAGLGLFLVSRSAEPPAGGCALPPGGGPQKAWLEATLSDSPVRFEDGFRVALRASLTRGAEKQELCGNVLLTVVGTGINLTVGDRILVHAHLRRPRNFQNPGARDQVGELARRGIWITAYAPAENVRRIGHGPAGWRGVIAAERLRIGSLIDASLPPPEAGLLRALVVGEQNAVDRELRDEIARAGLAHLLSVSGLHVGMVWGVGFAVFRWLGSRSEVFLLRGNVRMLSASGAAIPAILYGLLAGGSVPTERSVVMLLFPIAALAVGREVRLMRILAMTALALALAHPGSPLEISYQLSFVSVLALLAGVGRWSRQRDPLETLSGFRTARARLNLALLVSTSALLGTAPLVAYHFNRVTPVGLLANPLLVPLCGLAPTLLGLAGAALSLVSDVAAQWAFSLAYGPLALLRFGVGLAVRLPFACLRVPTPSLAEITLLYGLFSLPWISRRLRRPVAAGLLIALLADAGAWLYERSLRDDVRMRFLDVGQGDAAVIELPRGRVLVVDGGGFSRSRFDVGERVVARYLWTRKILHVDFIAASHGDWDHQGGLHFLAEEFSPVELWRGSQPGEAARLERLAKRVEARGGIVRTLHPGGVAFERNGVSIRCLHPPGTESLSSNDSSLVLHLTMGSVSVVFAGDIEAVAENALRARPEAHDVSILKVPHHGSSTSSSEALLRALHPKIVVFSLGAGNPFGFPHPEVLARYAEAGSRIYRTDLDGSVWAFTDGRRLSLRPFARASPVFCSGLGALC